MRGKLAIVGIALWDAAMVFLTVHAIRVAAPPATLGDRCRWDGGTPSWLLRHTPHRPADQNPKPRSSAPIAPVCSAA
jgi:hypothetical protein